MGDHQTRLLALLHFVLLKLVPVVLIHLPVVHLPCDRALVQHPGDEAGHLNLAGAMAIAVEAVPADLFQETEQYRGAVVGAEVDGVIDLEATVGVPVVPHPQDAVLR